MEIRDLGWERFSAEHPDIAAQFCEAVKDFAELARMGCGASRAAASVLLYAFNKNDGIFELYRLDGGRFVRAMVIIEISRYIEGDIVQTLMPYDVRSLKSLVSSDGEQ